MKHKKIPVASVVVPEVRITAVYAQETAELLRSSLEAQGQRVPIVVVEVGEKYHLVDGVHRLEEAKHRQETHIDAVISQGDDKDVLLQNLTLNHVRGKVTPGDMLEVIKELTDKHGMDSEAISAGTGFPRDYIEKFWKISETSWAVKAALEAQEIGIGQALELARLPDHRQQEMVLGTYPMSKWTVKETRETIDNIIAQIPQERPQQIVHAYVPPPPPVCSTCERETDIRFLNTTTLCPDCMKGAWEVGQPLKPSMAQPIEAVNESGGA